MGVWSDYLDMIRVRPGMHLGSNSGTAFYHHMVGFGEALRYADGRKDAAYEDFMQYLREKYPSGNPWAGVSRAQDANEEELLNLFLNTWEEFMGRRGRSDS